MWICLDLNAAFSEEWALSAAKILLKALDKFKIIDQNRRKLNK